MRKKLLRYEKHDLLLAERRLIEICAPRLDRDEANKYFRKRTKELVKEDCMRLNLKHR